MKKEKFGLLNFGSVEVLSKEEMKKVTGGYSNAWYNENNPSPPSLIKLCDCFIKTPVAGYPQLTTYVAWTSYTGSCYPRPAGITCD